MNINYTGKLAVDFPDNLKAGDSMEIDDTSNFYFRNDKFVKIIDASEESPS